eukprot:TRINITY_DN66591_c6_g1_i1.p3 TRINITY_DN66591_c6_g1~~TRINITY_DN66591_c6_g1_i1.p3  ORF type:complete len:136 (-),score=14.37 TRINITY_DN66591_c6_g1_i1:105-512(-)
MVGVLKTTRFTVKMLMPLLESGTTNTLTQIGKLQSKSAEKRLRANYIPQLSQYPAPAPLLLAEYRLRLEQDFDVVHRDYQSHKKKTCGGNVEHDECCVCLDNPGVALDCHLTHLVCVLCVMHITQCPLCREPVRH